MLLCLAPIVLLLSVLSNFAIISWFHRELVTNTLIVFLLSCSCYGVLCLFFLVSWISLRSVIVEFPSFRY